MLSSNDRNKWILGIFLISLFLGIYDSIIHFQTPGWVLSFVYIIGFALTFSILSGIPALLAACVFKFKKEKQKFVFIVWIISMIVLSLPILLNLQQNPPALTSLPT